MSADAQPPIGTPRQASTGIAKLLGSVVNVGRDILARRRQVAAQAPSDDLVVKCQQLLHHRGEASGLALACEVITDYQQLNDAHRVLFFEALARDFDVSVNAIVSAADHYKNDPQADQLVALAKPLKPLESSYFAE